MQGLVDLSFVVPQSAVISVHSISNFVSADTWPIALIPPMFLEKHTTETGTPPIEFKAVTEL